MVFLNLNTNSASLGVILLLSICLSTTWADVVRRSDEASNFNEDENRPVVRIPQGSLRGVNLVTRSHRNIFGFKSIPYAQPPVGDLRFKAPVPSRGWNGTLDASNDCKLCPQLVIGGTEVIGDEDCLYLNLYTPKLPEAVNSTLLPVMLYVFGGRFSEGHNNPSRWGPFFLLDKDVILVVPAYRMGALGYLSTGDEVSPGNYGLKDLVRALEWTRDNIRYFGGDPSQVTLVGGSTGAISVHLLTLSPLTNGLFHRYITQSGSALTGDSQRPQKSFVNRATQLAEHFGCPTNSSKVLVDCLRGVSASQIVKAKPIFEVWNGFPITVWGPTVEPDVEGALLTDTPRNHIAAGKVRDLPWIASVTRDEGIVHSAQFVDSEDKIAALLENIDVALPHVLQYASLVENVTAYTNALKSYYLNDLTGDKTLLLDNYTRLLSDAIAHSVYNGVEQQFVHAKAPTYFASFEYVGTLSYGYWFSKGSTQKKGVSHGDEILYLFRNDNDFFGPRDAKMNADDLKMVDTMVQLWTSFATNGTPISLDPNNATIWEPYSSRKSYLRIGNGPDTSLEAKHNYLEDRMKFWDELTAATSWK